MEIKVHGMGMSTCCARVLLCLEEKGLDYEVVPLDLTAGAHKQQPHLSLNPFGQIPAFEDGNVTLFESRAINRYLARKYEAAGTDLLRSGSLVESAVVDTWMEVEAHQFNGPIYKIIRQMIVNPIYGLPIVEEVVEAAAQNLGKVLDVYEERLGTHKYLAGENYTMADLNHIPYLVYMMRTDRAIIVNSRPRVKAWWEDISSRPATLKVIESMMPA
ncbi:glutathione S-transferase F13-like [Punica granatum]|uniref:glutathione transferase n=2 Tax=Punica granatum TaxID=22663 RepID=A0A218WGV5_PUNGR|nr:glutathione S-transferase F13-like [Punica granatum]OWM71252.1 hypothetical protein CDL15_Pgr011379 [Punica granatum]PKI37351.1 hypothetical protein CRG98_042261 [Punica granatum]